MNLSKSQREKLLKEILNSIEKKSNDIKFKTSNCFQIQRLKKCTI